MKIAEPLVQGEFIKRYKRFFADVRIDGELVVAHVPNTGSLKTCLYPGSACIVSKSTNPERKLKATLHFLKTPTSWVGVNTSLPNALVHEAWENNKIKEWLPFKAAQREYKISKESRLDMVLAPDQDHLDNKKKLHHIEVKNVTYAENETAFFPDSVTERGQKHLKDLMDLKKKGFGSEIVFVIQRMDCKYFSPADEIDPEYGRLLRMAVEKGVDVRALACEIDPSSGLTLNTKPLKLKL